MPLSRRWHLFEQWRFGAKIDTKPLVAFGRSVETCVGDPKASFVKTLLSLQENTWHTCKTCAVFQLRLCHLNISQVCGQSYKSRQQSVFLRVSISGPPAAGAVEGAHFFQGRTGSLPLTTGDLPTMKPSDPIPRSKHARVFCLHCRTSSVCCKLRHQVR